MKGGGGGGGGGEIYLLLFFSLFPKPLFLVGVSQTEHLCCYT